MGSPSRTTISNPNTTTTPKLPPIPKRVHYILIAALIPSWSFGLPLLILDSSVWSILAFIFSTFSSLISLYRVRNEERYQYQIRLPGDDDQEVESVGKHAGVFACVDFVLAGGLINWIILALVEGSGRWRWNPAMPFLLAYGSMVWFGQCFLHFYFLFRYIKYRVSSGFRRSKKSKASVLCTRCQSLICEDGSHSPTSAEVTERTERGREALV